MRLNKILQSIFTITAIVALFSSCFHEDNRINATCFDEILNQEELFVDCGGPNCEECPPTCDNGILDWFEGWQEVGIDCGGPCETCCENERWDVNPYDPTLSEEWIDCGGPECPPCELCSNGVNDPGEEFFNPNSGLIEPAIDCDGDPLTECPPCSDLCNDGLLNGLEEACADCGGVCTPCDNSQCTNEVLDVYNPEATTSVQSETYIDCGGCMCIPCWDISLCSDGYVSGYELTENTDPEFGPGIDCGGSICVPCNDISLCSDGYLSGYETEIDCYDGEDGLSACPPCNSTCLNGVCDGLETDTDCGGDFCPPCAIEGEDGNFLIYTVTTSDETEVLYESANSTLTGLFQKGILMPPDPPLPLIIVQDQIAFGGGSCHSIGFNLEDDDDVPLFWDKEEDFYLNFIAQTLPSPDNIILNANTNNFVYESRISPTGMTLNDFNIDGPNPIAGGTDLYEITVEGTFFGELKVADDAPEGIGEIATISNGSFRITWQQIIPM